MDQAPEARIDALVEALGTDHPDLFRELLANVAGLASDRTQAGYLELIRSTVAEFRRAAQVFGEYDEVRKVAIFGSARTQPDEIAYRMAVDFGAAMADQGWMTITGAGPGIMQAGIEGATRERSFGVAIKLPFEPEAPEVIAGDPKLITFSNFFTRKVTFIDEADGFCLLPGGFGTMDEGFELLTLLQTGKTTPSPVVLLESPEDDYWSSWLDFVDSSLHHDGLISTHDRALFCVAHTVADAVAEIAGFYRRYDGLDDEPDRLVVRIKGPVPSQAQVDELNDAFADIVDGGTIEPIEPLGDVSRLAFRFNHRGYARLRSMIDTINTW